MPIHEVLHMQVRIFRKFAARHRMNTQETLELFQKYGLLDFISECYDLLHLSGDECVLDDIDELLRHREVCV